MYFDNVGGDILDAALARLARGARVVICGAISQYNKMTSMSGPSNYMSLLVNRARMEGFVVIDYMGRAPEATREMAGWITEGKLIAREDVVEGFESFPDALQKLFRGENVGKLVLKVGKTGESRHTASRRPIFKTYGFGVPLLYRDVRVVKPISRDVRLVEVRKMSTRSSETQAHAPQGAQAGPRWHDRKRYAWLLGLIVPLLPFISWGLVEATGLGVFWFYGPVLIFGAFPLLDLLVGLDASNPPDSVIKWLEQDRYYRWCTYLFLPLQYAGLVFACWMWSRGGLLHA